MTILGATLKLVPAPRARSLLVLGYPDVFQVGDHVSQILDHRPVGAFSAHCCPSLTLHPACAVPQIAHLEYFFDHARAERMLFEGAPAPDAGEVVRPEPRRPGLGLELKREARRLRVA